MRQRQKILTAVILVSQQSARLVCAYLYSCAGEGESTQDLVYSGHNMIAEYGSILKESRRFQNSYIETEIDLQRLEADRRRMTTFVTEGADKNYERVYFRLKEERIELSRYFERTPFIPSNKIDREKRCDEILTIQAMGLKSVWHIPTVSRQLSESVEVLIPLLQY